MPTTNRRADLDYSEGKEVVECFLQDRWRGVRHTRDDGSGGHTKKKEETKIILNHLNPYRYNKEYNSVMGHHNRKVSRSTWGSDAYPRKG